MPVPCRVRLIAPDRSHEDPSMELPGIGASPDSSRTDPPCADALPQCGVHLRGPTAEVFHGKYRLEDWL
jgi:hypothetical protein